MNPNLLNRTLGYIFTGLGMIGFFFFLNYKGSAIPLKELWFVVSIFIVGVGGYFLAKYKIRKQSNEKNSDSQFARIQKLKKNGEKVKVTQENAEVKSRTYQQEIANDHLPTQIEMMDSLYDDNRNYRTREIRQTYIVFYKKYGDKSYRFVSPATLYEPEALREFIIEKRIDIYIDPANPTNYYFDFSVLSL